MAQQIDIGILTIRDDEFEAVLDAFPDDLGDGFYKGKHREYALRQASAGKAGRYSLAILRQIEQGNGEAQAAARDLLKTSNRRCFWSSGLQAVSRRIVDEQAVVLSC